MADEKKPEAKPAPIEKKDPFVEIVWMFGTVFLIMYLLNGLLTAITSTKLFSNGLEGLTPRGILLSHTRPIVSLVNPIGVRVVSINNTEVLDSPGGFKIGQQKFSARGKILQGPVSIRDIRYWYVDYDLGTDGWVKESDIAYLESEPNFLERRIINFLSLLAYIKLFLVLLSVLVFFYILYLNKEIGKIRLNESKLLYPQSPPITSATNPQWERILTHTDSLNENDWKLSIIEADIMLNDLLDKLFLPGETIGEKLKAVEKSDFTTVESAWEAHKIRNRIAHDGATFVLNQHETKRVIALYKEVFDEFHVI